MIIIINIVVLLQCGNSISNYQRDLLISLGVDEVIIAMTKNIVIIQVRKQKYGKDIVN